MLIGFGGDFIPTNASVFSFRLGHPAPRLCPQRHYLTGHRADSLSMVAAKPYTVKKCWSQNRYVNFRLD